LIFSISRKIKPAYLSCLSNTYEIFSTHLLANNALKGVQDKSGSRETWFVGPPHPDIVGSGPRNDSFDRRIQAVEGAFSPCPFVGPHIAFGEGQRTVAGFVLYPIDRAVLPLENCMQSGIDTSEQASPLMGIYTPG
jgi:hypothetical protein